MRQANYIIQKWGQNFQKMCFGYQHFHPKIYLAPKNILKYRRYCKRTNSTVSLTGSVTYTFCIRLCAAWHIQVSSSSPVWVFKLGCSSCPQVSSLSGILHNPTITLYWQFSRKLRREKARKRRDKLGLSCAKLSSSWG